MWSPGFLVYASDMQKLTMAIEYCGISLENHRIKKTRVKIKLMLLLGTCPINLQFRRRKENTEIRGSQFNRCWKKEV